MEKNTSTYNNFFRTKIMLCLKYDFGDTAENQGCLDESKSHSGAGYVNSQGAEMSTFVYGIQNFREGI